MIKFLYPTLFDAATVTTSSANASYPNTNLQTDFLKQTWRSTGVSAEWMKFDLGSAQGINLFTFFYNNLTAGATVVLYGNTSDLGATKALWTAAAFSQTFTAFNSRAALCQLAATQTYRYWFVSLEDAANTNGYLEVGRVFAGLATTTTNNFAESMTETIMDSSATEFTVGRTAYSVVREKYSNLSFTFQDITQADQLIIRTFYNLVGKTEPCVLVLDSTNEPKNLTRYGILTSDLAWQWGVNLRATCALQFTELR